MKKLLTTISLAIIFLFSFNEKIIAQYVTIPDTAFVNWLNANGYSTCMIGNQMDTTCNAITFANTLFISGINIHDVSGIRYFNNVFDLHINNTAVDSIFELPVPNLINILDLHSNNFLKYVDLSIIPYPVQLNISHCAFDELPDLFHTYSFFDCSYNNLSSVVITNGSITGINCSHNSLTNLEVYATPWSLYLNDNPNLTCLVTVPVYLDTLIFYNTGLACLPEAQDTVIFSSPNYYSFPNCALYNPNGCPVTHQIGGTIYQDANTNCNLDTTENLLSGIPVRIYSNGTFMQEGFTNNLGTYSFFTPQTGTYTVSVDSSVLPLNIICPSSGTDTAVITLTDTLDNDNDFSLQCGSLPDGKVSTVVNDSGFFQPNGSALVSIFAGDAFSFYNANCSGNLSGTVTAIFNGPVTYAGVKAGSLVPAVIGNTLTWTITDFNTVNPYTDFHVRFITDTSAQLGSGVCINATISINQADANVLNNSANNCFIVQSSFDPNFKEVNPTTLTYNPIPLTYTIHFQNTGTASANNIFILDTLDSELDLSSFRFLGASHYCIPQILQGGILRFNFPNINLPDSNSNEPASHGWVQYGIQQQDGPDPFTVIIENTANIYFDFNSPVVTNTTVTPFAEGIDELKNDNDFIIYPNPSSDELTVMLRQALHDNYTIVINNVLGKEVLCDRINSNSKNINLKSFQSGVYYVRLISSNGKTSVRKLIVVK